MGGSDGRAHLGTRAFARPAIIVIAAVGGDGEATLWRRSRWPREQIRKGDGGSNDCGLREISRLVYSSPKGTGKVLLAETEQRNNISNTLSATSSAIELRSAEGKRR